MAWNEPGKDKDKQKDPWQSGGGQQPPDLDEIFRNLKGNVTRLFGGKGNGSRGNPTKRGGSGGSGGIALIVLLGVAVWVVVTSFYIIDEQERGVVLRFGKHVKTMQPGFNVTLPRPIDQVYKVNVTQLSNEKTSAQMLTVDENIVDVSLDVQYKILDPEDYLFYDVNPDNSLIQVAESAMRQVVGDNTLDYVLLEGRSQMTSTIKEIIQETLDNYQSGLIVNNVNFESVKQPQEVKEAFDDAIKAREDKERSQREATAYANQKIPESRGTAARLIQEAEAYKAVLVTQAKGEVERFNLLLSEYQRAPEVTRQRLYLETMENVLGRTPKVLLDADGGGNLMMLPLEQIMNGKMRQRLSPSDNNTMPRELPSFQASPEAGRTGLDRDSSSRPSRGDGR